MPDGFVVDVLGPYEGTVNDATILKELLHRNEDLKRLLEEEDVFVLDRGFRDVVQDLEGSGFKVLMPAFKGKNPQLSTAESNYSRLVTKIRWPVEAVHGAVGLKYKMLHNTLSNKQLENASALCKIACYLNNEFGKRFLSDSEMTDEIIAHFKQVQPEYNTLAKQVADERWSRRKTQFEILDPSCDSEDFPRLSINELKVLYTGTYQLKMCITYLAEMVRKVAQLIYYIC